MSDVTNPVSVSHSKATGTGYPIIPSYACFSPGGAYGQGFADGLSLVGWQNQINDTYQEVTVVTVPDPVQLASFPATDQFATCAITAAAHVIALGPRSLSFYKTSQPDTPFAIDRPGCPLMWWLGTFGQHEHFYHGNVGECNCADKESKPCPPGIQLLGEYEVTPYLVNFSTGFYTAGHDFQVGGSSPSTSQWNNVTYPLEFTNVNNDTNWRSGIVLCYAEGMRNLSLSDPLVFGKVIMAGPLFPTSCPAGAFARAVLAAGAVGFIRILRETVPLAQFTTPPTQVPYLFATYAMGLSLKLAWNATPPEIIPPPASTPTSIGSCVNLQGSCVVVLMVMALLTSL